MSSSYRLISLLSISIFSSTTTFFIADKVSAQNTSFPNYDRTLEIAQTPQTDILYNQMNQYMGAAFQGIPVFAKGLSQMQTIQDDQQLYALVQQLIPVASNIAGNFNQAYQIGQQLMPMIPANSPYATIIQQWTLLNGQGANTFASWIETLIPMQQALETQNLQQMEGAIAQMQNAVNQTVTLANGVQTVTQQTNNIIASYQNSTTTANSGGFSNDMTMAEFEMMSRMSSMMHETSMGILNNMGSDGEWRYNPATGEDEYIHY